jgi:hypothetical protein
VKYSIDLNNIIYYIIYYLNVNLKEERKFICRIQ